MFHLEERDVLFLRQLARDYFSGALRANPRQLKRPADEAPIEISIGKTAEAISAGGSGDVTRWTVTSDAFASASETVTAWDWFGQGIPNAVPVVLVRLPHKEGMRWIAIDPSGTNIGKANGVKVTLTATLATTNATVTATVDRYWSGTNPNPGGGTFTVYNQEASTNYMFSGAIGAKALCYYDDVLDRYYIYQIECP